VADNVATVVLRPMKQVDIPMLQDWYAGSDLSNELDGDDLPHQFANMQSDPSYWAWIACVEDEPVGFVWFEIVEDGIGNESLGIHPNLRNRGYGSAMLRSLAATPEARRAVVIVANIYPENVASIRCHEKAGFVCENTELDEEGFLRFIHR
jgi:RimJ/RimL family protein N-acetyltransferase